MIIDVHCHAWPDALAERALGGRVPQLERHGDGKISSLHRVLARSGVDRGVLLGIADTARHVDAVNRFVAARRGPDLLPFGTVHPDLPLEDNLASLRRHGITGVKLHSLFQGFAYDDPRVWDLLEAFGSRIAVIAHVGAGGDLRSNERATPAMVRAIVRRFPDLRLIACHLGGYHRLEEAQEQLLGENVFLETSWPPTMARLAPERVRAIIGRHGADRVVFGSDWPMADPAAEIAAIRALGLSEEATAGILGDNAARILGLPAARPPAVEPRPTGTDTATVRTPFGEPRPGKGGTDGPGGPGGLGGPGGTGVPDGTDTAAIRHPSGELRPDGGRGGTDGPGGTRDAGRTGGPGEPGTPGGPSGPGGRGEPRAPADGAGWADRPPGGPDPGAGAPPGRHDRAGRP